mmetsp:Transcript_62039/g.196143  ORF Transcript_62039/g.196143 Transcript_62039/m.196143 type:complete len:421 (+) Transcript_62039:1258-2520(+)
MSSPSSGAGMILCSAPHAFSAASHDARTRSTSRRSPMPPPEPLAGASSSRTCSFHASALSTASAISVPRWESTGLESSSLWSLLRARKGTRFQLPPVSHPASPGAPFAGTSLGAAWGCTGDSFHALLARASHARLSSSASSSRAQASTSMPSVRPSSSISESSEYSRRWDSPSSASSARASHTSPAITLRSTCPLSWGSTDCASYAPFSRSCRSESLGLSTARASLALLSHSSAAQRATSCESSSISTESTSPSFMRLCISGTSAYVPPSDMISSYLSCQAYTFCSLSWSGRSSLGTTSSSPASSISCSISAMVGSSASPLRVPCLGRSAASARADHSRAAETALETAGRRSSLTPSAAPSLARRFISSIATCPLAPSMSAVLALRSHPAPTSTRCESLSSSPVLGGTPSTAARACSSWS